MIKSDIKITVVDTIMGGGKTTWAIQLMNEAPEIQKFIFITPFITEIDRIVDSVSNRKFMKPTEKNKRGTKTEGFKQLLKMGANIVATHQLFLNCDNEILDLIKVDNYILILDEAISVIEQIKINEVDMNMVFNEGLVVEENKWVKWKSTADYNGRFIDIKEKCFNGNLYKYSKNIFYWCFPIDIFNAFDSVFVLTYMFRGQVQKYYYDMFNVEYVYKSVAEENGKYKLIDYFIEDRQVFKGLINIYQGELNEIGNKENDLSATKLKRISKDLEKQKGIKNNISNFFKNIVKSKSDNNMWTTLNECKGALKSGGYTKGFVACNSRATNEFRNKRNLAYIVNRFINPIEKNFFKENGVDFDEEMFALSELLQWIFRSAVRDGQYINIYIPSRRMRELLMIWLNNEI